MARSGPALALLLVLTTAALAKYEELEGWRGGEGWSGMGGVGGGAARLRLAALEAEDERHDAELLAAVTASVRQWQMKRARTRSKRSQGSVCYGEFGCFEDAGPFAYLETLPSPPQEVGTHFLLYSTLSRGDQPLLSVPASNMSAAWAWAARAFDSHKSTRVIVHGFGSNCDNVWVYEMRSALMAVEECNVICVDWEGGAVMPNYLRAAANTRLVGKQLAMLLTGLSKNINLRFQDVHLIGFSLGAHVAGFAGSELGNISRITGLDPAGPLFEFQDPRARLDSNDAKFVDVIHSNGDSLLVGGLGAAQPLGHVDFYPNGGRVQHGCSNLFLGAVSDLVLPWSAPTPEGRSLCNHRRAYKFFTDSVSPKCHFPAFPCSNYDQFLEGKCFPCGGDRRCGNMGYYADRSLGRGQLYLLTREEEPFCAHQYQVTVVGSEGAAQAGGGAGASAGYGRVALTLHGDSGLNETFPITKKEDTLLPRGGRLARMIVPHPALGAPLRATLHYAAYSGWLSAGAKTLAIEKLLIADSFGNMSSYCKRMELVSNEPVDIPLRPGDCQLPKEDIRLESTNDSKLAKITEDKTQASTTVDPLENELPNDIRTFQSIFEAADLLELGKTSVGDGRAFGLTNTKKVAGGGSEIAEPILRPRPHKTPRNRVDDTHREISEPVLRATQPPPSRKAKHMESEKTTISTYDLMPHSDHRDRETEETGFAVQFLPTRLASFISRAERYARDTLLPLVSAYAPRLPIFGAREMHRPVARYIPTEPDNSTAPIPTPTLEAKIEALKTVGPPKMKEDIPVDVEPAIMDSSEGQVVRREDSKREEVKEARRNYTDKVKDFRIGVSTSTEDSLKVYRAEKTEVRVDMKDKDVKSGVIELNEKEVLKQEPVSTSTSTALPPVAVKSPNGEERLLIVYPSNARDERKIRSHSYPEVLQFEALYRHTASPDLHVDLPTYRPPSTSPLTTTVNAVSSPSDKFIPVTQSSDSKFIPVVFKDDGTTVAPKL